MRDEPLGVLGGNPQAVEHALLVRQWSDDVVLFAHGTVLDADQRARLTARGIGIVDGPVARLVVEDDRLTGVEIADGVVAPRTAVFVRPRFVPNDGLLTSLGCAANPQGWVTTDATGLTTVPGVWAAGNAVNPRAQVITRSLALVTAPASLLAMVSNPFFGRLSDRTTSRRGMRRPWMVIGLAGGSVGLRTTRLCTILMP